MKSNRQPAGNLYLFFPQPPPLETYIFISNSTEQRVFVIIDFAALIRVLFFAFQNSLPLRNLLFVLHNNGIYVERIVESVKSYLSISSF